MFKDLERLTPNLEYKKRTMAADEPLVSVIMPAYNAELTICQSLESVLKQTYSNYEVIIVDDGSDLSVKHVLGEYPKEKIKIETLSENRGAGLARNRGLSIAEGRFVAFLDADDLWHPEKLQKQITFMKSNRIAVSHTLYQESLDRKVTSISYSPSQQSFNDILRVNHIGCLTVIIDQEKVGKFQFPSLKRRQDYALWLQISKKHTFHLLPEVLSTYRKDNIESLSKNRLKVLKGFYLVYKNLGYKPIVATLLTIRYSIYYNIKRKKYDTSSIK